MHSWQRPQEKPVLTINVVVPVPDETKAFFCPLHGAPSPCMICEMQKIHTALFPTGRYDDRFPQPIDANFN